MQLNGLKIKIYQMDMIKQSNQNLEKYYIIIHVIMDILKIHVIDINGHFKNLKI